MIKNNNLKNIFELPIQMSIFDVSPNPKNPNFEFFHSLEKNMEQILKKMPLFECYVFVLKQSGVYIKCPIRIIDEKLILFKVIMF